MEEEFLDVEKSVYAGMSIYSIIKDNEIIIEGQKLSLGDKKYLSLYLGVINTTNRFSNFLKEKQYKYNLNISYKILDTNKYLNLYSTNFVDIFKEIPFNSFDEYLLYLLNKDIIKRINELNNYTFEEFNIKGNKTLVKQII